VAVHYYHCTDGKNLILDLTGRRTRSRKHVELLAGRVAGEMMQSMDADVDWSGWLVSVQDNTGSMVTVVPFSAQEHEPNGTEYLSRCVIASVT
jgi:hypothetical protein